MNTLYRSRMHMTLGLYVEGGDKGANIWPRWPVAGGGPLRGTGVPEHKRAFGAIALIVHVPRARHPLRSITLLLYISILATPSTGTPVASQPQRLRQSYPPSPRARRDIMRH